MFDYDKWQEIFGTIRKNKLRTFLTALGVFWGIFMLIVLMGAGTGLQNGVFAMFGGIAKNSLFLGSSRTTMPYQGLPRGRVPEMKNEDMTAILEEFPQEIDILSPIIWISTGEISRKGLSGAFDVEGHTPDIIKIDERELMEGRFVNKKDMDEQRKVVVIGKRVKAQLFKKGEKVIGERIKINGGEYQVVGIFKVDRGDGDSDEENTIIMPLSTAQRVSNQPSHVAWFMCSMKEGHSAQILEPKLRSFLKKRHRIHPDDPRGFWTNNVEEEFKEISNLFTGIKLLIWFVGVGSLLFGILGVGNIMLIVVKDRTKEIGIRKALGATPWSIISMILMESAFITTVAGYLGLVFSIGVVALMKAAVGDEGVNMFKNPEIDLGVAIGATLVLIIAGTLTGLIPAIQAANVNPVEALKDE